MSPHAIRLAVVGSFLLGATPALAQLQPLFRPTAREGTVRATRDSTVIRSQNVIVNIRLLRSEANRTLIVPLFDGTRLRLEKDRQELVGRNGFVWYGKVANEPGSTAIFSTVGEAVIGNIQTQRGKVYALTYLGGGVHSFREIDQSKFPREAEPMRPPEYAPADAADVCATDPPTNIDVLVVYTADARTAAGGTAAIEAAINLAVAETNQSYLNSQITQRVRLAHAEEVSYTESTDAQTDLNRVRNPTDGFMDNVQTLRNTHAADHVALIVENITPCGIGSMMTTVANTFETRAFVVVKRTCATGYYSFAHELGHNMGADHDAANATSTGPYPYNRGFVNTSPTAPATPWRTIMAYNGTPSSLRVHYWSNPNVSYPPGDPMGVSGASDNHQVLNNTALTVANFRCGSPAASTVWMKDTWSDTGGEPDPLTAGQPMWQSPYIWVRNAQDVGLVHQHEHQNPELGSPNWVYVKLHNGFATTASGTLELYWANASTGLSWPANWTLLASVPVTAFAANSTRVVEAQWAAIPGAGHFCLIARWVSAADPMTTAETANIDANVRGNNNIVWRNINVVDLVADAADVRFEVRNIGREGDGISLIVRAPKEEEKNSFLTHGQVIVHLDDTLLQAWRRGGGRSTGLKEYEKGFIVTSPAGSVFQNILLRRGATGRVTLTFRKLRTTPRGRFTIDAVQTGSRNQVSPASRYQQTEGGITYEIHTDRSSRR